MTRLFRRCEEDEELREQLFAKGSGYLLYHILDDLFDYCFPILDKIGHKLDSVEDDLFEKRAEEVVRDLSNVKQEIISYRKIIKPERSTLRLLERHVERFLPEQLELYFDDIVDASERIWDLLDNYKEVVEALEDTNESVISHRQNDVLRFLTVVTVILLPLTLITGIFGMNVHFPGFETAAAFWGIIGGMVGLAIGLTAFFRSSAGCSASRRSRAHLLGQEPGAFSLGALAAYPSRGRSNGSPAPQDLRGDEPVGGGPGGPSACSSRRPDRPSTRIRLLDVKDAAVLPGAGDGDRVTDAEWARGERHEAHAEVRLAVALPVASERSQRLLSLSERPRVDCRQDAAVAMLGEAKLDVADAHGRPGVLHEGSLHAVEDDVRPEPVHHKRSLRRLTSRSSLLANPVVELP